MSIADIFSKFRDLLLWALAYPIPWWTVLWWVLGVAAAWVVIVIVMAVELHFSTKKALNASGVVFAEKKKKER